VDGTDNLGVKYLINDACVLSKKPLVYGSLYKFDGYVSSFNILKDDGTYSCNLRDAFPKMATDIPNCEEAGTLNPIVGAIALLQVNEVVKYITKTGKLLADKLLIYNVLENSQYKIKLKKNVSVDVASVFRESTYLIDYCANQKSDLLISANELKNRLKVNKTIIVSVINNLETEIPFPVDQKTPLRNFDIESFDVDLDKEYIIVCNRGITSYDVTLKLKDKYPNLSVLSLSGGINNYL
jgi:adenylyltransferase/sulfurtransferase